MLYSETIGHFFPAFSQSEADQVECIAVRAESAEHFRELLKKALRLEHEPDIPYGTPLAKAYQRARPGIVIVDLNPTFH